MGRLDGKVAVITGGAYGIGAATVKLFVDEGARVVFGDIEDEKGDSYEEELGENAVYQHCNVASGDDIKSLIDMAVERFGQLDIMFSNAGIGGPNALIDETPLDEYDKAMEILLRGPFIGTMYAAKQMKKQGTGGSIISTASVAGLQAGNASHCYSIAKAGVISMTRSVSTELGEYGIRINCICPGGIATGIFGTGMGLKREQAEQVGQMIKPALAKAQPLKRAGMPIDIANAALFLGSDESGFVTGHALVVDGALSVGRNFQDMLNQMGGAMAPGAKKK